MGESSFIQAFLFPFKKVRDVKILVVIITIANIATKYIVRSSNPSVVLVKYQYNVDKNQIKAMIAGRKKIILFFVNLPATAV